MDIEYLIIFLPLLGSIISGIIVSVAPISSEPSDGVSVESGNSSKY